MMTAATRIAVAWCMSFLVAGATDAQREPEDEIKKEPSVQQLQATRRVAGTVGRVLIQRLDQTEHRDVVHKLEAAQEAWLSDQRVVRQAAARLAEVVPEHADDKFIEDLTKRVERYAREIDLNELAGVLKGANRVDYMKLPWPFNWRQDVPAQVRKQDG